MHNSVFEKTMKSVRKNRDIILVTTEKRRNYLVSEPNYHTTKFFSENLLEIEIKKTQIFINKSVFRFVNIRNKLIVMYEFWYDSVKPKYNKIANIC